MSSYPFAIFGQGWEHAMPERWPNRGDIEVGHDFWIGLEATILPVIGGALIATCDS